MYIWNGKVIIIILYTYDSHEESMVVSVKLFYKSNKSLLITGDTVTTTSSVATMTIVVVVAQGGVWVGFVVVRRRDVVASVVVVSEDAVGVFHTLTLTTPAHRLTDGLNQGSTGWLKIKYRTDRIVYCWIHRSVRIKQRQEFLKSDHWLRRYCILSGGVFYFEPPCIFHLTFFSANLFNYYSYHGLGFEPLAIELFRLQQQNVNSLPPEVT